MYQHYGCLVMNDHTPKTKPFALTLADNAN